MKVAVQGASGFVGSRLVEWLHLRGMAEVVPIVRSYSSLTRIARFDLDWKLADALDEDALAKAFEGCEIVFHTVAGPAWTILQSPEKTVKAALRAGVKRVVYVSTGVTYGFNPDPNTKDDTKAIVDQQWIYNRSKAKAEEKIAELRRLPGVDFVVLIPTIVYGPRSASFTTLIAEDLLAGTACLVDEGKGICNAIYVDNLVEAMWLAATVPEAKNQDFIVSDKERVTWRDLYQSVADAVGVTLDGVRMIDRDYAVSVVQGKAGWKSRLAKEIKSGPAHSLIDRVPIQTRERLRRSYWAWRSVGTDGGGPADAFSRVTPEQLAVQICDFQLPIEKAQRVLGYNPIPFEEASRRTGAWLQANGYSANAGAFPNPISAKSYSKS